MLKRGTINQPDSKQGTVCWQRQRHAGRAFQRGRQLRSRKVQSDRRKLRVGKAVKRKPGNGKSPENDQKKTSVNQHVYDLFLWSSLAVWKNQGNQRVFRMINSLDPKNPMVSPHAAMANLWGKSHFQTAAVKDSWSLTLIKLVRMNMNMDF